MGKLFAGVIPPMITPLTEEEEIDRPAVARLVSFLIKGGVDGLFVLGTIGEGPHLRASARVELVEASVEAAGGQVPVIAGVLEPGSARVIEEILRLRGRGLAGYVVTTPFYYKGYGEGELRDHFHRIAEASDLPILLYNIPQNTGIALKSELVLRLAETEGYVGIKDSSGDWTEVQAILQRRGSEFVVLQGMQSLCAVSLLAGADGLVAGHANVYPRLLADLMAAGLRHDVDAVFAHQEQLDRLVRLRGRASIHGLKLVAKALGLTDESVTSPTPRFTQEERRAFLRASAAADPSLSLAGMAV